MPSIDLRQIKVAKYTNTNGTITYSNGTSIGDAMAVDLQLKFAEGRLYAESTLAEYIKMATGGTISIAEKYIPDAAKTLLFGTRTGSRSISYTASGGTRVTTTAASTKYGAADIPQYAGVSFYAPDMIDGTTKFTCVFIPRALFGPPAMSYKTKADNIVFNTPTTTGEFLPDHSSTKELIEEFTAENEELAKAWCNKVLNIT